MNGSAAPGRFGARQSLALCISTLLVAAAPPAAGAADTLPIDADVGLWVRACGTGVVDNRSCQGGGAQVRAGGFTSLLSAPGAQTTFRARLTVVEATGPANRLTLQSEGGTETIEIGAGHRHQSTVHRGRLRAKTHGGLARVHVDYVSIAREGSQGYQIVGAPDYHALEQENHASIRAAGGSVFGFTVPVECTGSKCGHDIVAACRNEPCFKITRCTALRIGEKLFLTAGHCTDDRPVPGGPDAEIVRFGANGKDIAGWARVDGAIRPHPDIDVGLIWLKAGNGVQGDVYSLRHGTRSADTGQAYLVQWQTSFKKDTKSEVNVSADPLCRTLEPCGKRALSTMSFWHRCDTDYGSSGAPIFYGNGRLAGLSVKRVLDEQIEGMACNHYAPKTFNEAEPFDSVLEVVRSFCDGNRDVCTGVLLP